MDGELKTGHKNIGGAQAEQFTLTTLIGTESDFCGFKVHNASWSNFSLFVLVTLNRH